MYKPLIAFLETVLSFVSSKILAVTHVGVSYIRSCPSDAHVTLGTLPDHIRSLPSRSRYNLPEGNVLRNRAVKRLMQDEKEKNGVRMVI